MSRMLEYLPPYERNSKIFKEIMSTEEEQFNKLDLDIQDLERQFNIDTATWGLSIYEKELKLPIRINKSLEERRSIIKAKWIGTGKVDAEMIKAIVKAFTGSEVVVTFDGRINIIFSNEKTIRLNVTDMLNAINEIKPAHLDYDFTNEHTKELQLQTGMKEYPVHYNMCGNFLCGTKPYVMNQGITFNTKLNVNTNKTNTTQRYNMAGTFKSGGGNK